jgi:hypothetical protein
MRSSIHTKKLDYWLDIFQKKMKPTSLVVRAQNKTKKNFKK